MIAPSTDHIPVLLTEVLDYLAVQPGQLYVDGTFGRGGYSEAILQAGGKVLALDQDPTAAIAAQRLRAQYPHDFTFVQANFRDTASVMTDHNLGEAQGFVLDIGVSSPQLDDAHRGFSFSQNGPLDMRMACAGPTAADVLASTSEADLAAIFWRYGEEKKARRIAHTIVSTRADSPLTTTHQLASLIEGHFSAKERAMYRLHPATRCFQALRIYVNDELGALDAALQQSPSVLGESGRLVVVTFHSLEDRIVKDYITHTSGQAPTLLPQDLAQLAASTAGQSITFKKLTKKPITATEAEIARNPRARSAKLRAAERVGGGA